MNIKLTSVPLTLAVVRYPHRGGACLGGSILADKPSSMLKAFEAHHFRFRKTDDASMMHLTISAPRVIRLTPRAWRVVFASTLRDLGAPLHQLVWVAYRHLRAATDHIHLLFSRYTIHGAAVALAKTPDMYELGNRLSRRLRLPTPFPDVKSGPTKIHAPVRSINKGKHEGISDMGVVGQRVNEALAVERPDRYSSFMEAVARHGVCLQVRHYQNGTNGLAYAMDQPKPKTLREFRPPVWIPGGRVGSQFTLKGILRRLDLLRYLNELPSQVAVMKLFGNAPDSTGAQLDLWKELNEQRRKDYRLDGQRRGGRGSYLAAGPSVGGDRWSVGSAGSGTGASPGRGEFAAQEVVRVPLELATDHHGHSNKGQHDPRNNRIDQVGPVRSGRAVEPDGKDVARDTRALDEPRPLTLVEIVGTLARLTEKWLITLSLRLEEGGGFVISGAQMPFLRYRPNRGAEILAPDFSHRMQNLADELGLRVVPAPASGGPQMTAEIISTGGPSFHEEDRPMEDLEQKAGPDL